jgi:hypothetical protein
MFNINIEHFLGKKHWLGSIKSSKSLDEILIENSDYSCTSRLKDILIKNNILYNSCYECKLGTTWNGKKNITSN